MGCGATKAVQVQPADAVEPLAPGDHPGTSGIPSGVELELDRLSTLDDLPSGESGEPRVLLLGAGDCGKSTLFRQLQLLYGGTAAAKNSYVLAGAVRSHLFHTLREATQGMARLGIEFAEPQNIARAQTLLDVAKVDDATVRGLDDDVAAVGADAGLRDVLKRGAAVHLPESAAYFLDAASRILAPGYVPTGDDVLRMRVRTRGVALAQISAFGRDFEVVDVGGARTERRKWAGRLRGAAAVFWVGSLAEFDQPLYEDEEVNRLDESVALWRETAAMPELEGAALSVFLCKRDVLASKAAAADADALATLRARCAGSGGDADGADPSALVAQRYLDACPRLSKADVHAVDATDAKDVRAALDAAFRGLAKPV